MSKLCAVSRRVELNLHVAAHRDVKLVATSFLVHKRRLMEDVESLRKLNFTFSF